MAWPRKGMAETLQGNPCGVCGSTQRYKSSRGCVPCARRRGQVNSQVRREREKEQAA